MTVQEKNKPIKKSVGKFALEKLLSETAVGDVFLATKDNKLAIVELFTKLEPEEVRLAQHRAKLLQKADFPSLLPPLEVGESAEGNLFIASSNPNASTMAEQMAEWRNSNEQPTPIELLKQIIEVARAVQEANQAGLVHQDLRPSNILLLPERKPAVLGLATPAEAVKSDGRHIEISSYQVYLDYISPEQAQGSPANEQSHIYSLGIMLYELFSGARPQLPVSRWDVFELEWLPKETPLQDVRPNLQEETYQVVANSIWRRQWDRPDSLDRFIEQLTAALDAETNPKKKPIALPLPPAQLAMIGGGILLLAIISFFIFRGGNDAPAIADSGSGAAAVVADEATATSEPTSTPTQIPPTETATATSAPTIEVGAIALLRPLAETAILLNDVISFAWSWQQPLQSDEKFSLYLVEGETQLLAGEVSLPAGDDTYELDIDAAQFDPSASYSWYVTLENGDGQQIGFSDPTPISFTTATATPENTPTMAATATPLPTSTPTPTPQCVVSPPSGWVQYSIQAGDSLYQLAVDVGFDPEYVLGINCVTTNTILSIGQTVWLPIPPATATPLPSPTSEQTGGGGNGGNGGDDGNNPPPRATSTPPPPPGG